MKSFGVMAYSIQNFFSIYVQNFKVSQLPESELQVIIKRY